MSHNDKIYCFTCGKITLDIDPIKIQDSRFNSHWQDRCVHCLSFDTINASLFLENKKSEIYTPITTSPLKGKLKKLGKRLVKEGIIKEFVIWKIGKPNFRLYKRRRIGRELEKAIKQFDSEQKLYNK